MVSMLGVGLKTDGANFLQVSVFWSSKIFLIKRKDGGQGECVGFIQFSDLKTSVGAKINEDMKTPIKRIDIIIYNITRI